MQETCASAFFSEFKAIIGLSGDAFCILSAIMLVSFLGDWDRSIRYYVQFTSCGIQGTSENNAPDGSTQDVLLQSLVEDCNRLLASGFEARLLRKKSNYIGHLRKIKIASFLADRYLHPHSCQRGLALVSQCIPLGDDQVQNSECSNAKWYNIEQMYIYITQLFFPHGQCFPAAAVKQPKLI